ncbi:MAG: hypothetical protein QMD73_01070 [Rhodocyclaceae bacterium]|nr:hypothetical protein [Rhodocyclaceae bacterium]
MRLQGSPPSAQVGVGFGAQNRVTLEHQGTRLLANAAPMGT